MSDPAQNSHRFWTGLMAALASKFGAPRDDLPSTRCIPKRAFVEALTGIRDALTLDGYKGIAGAKILEYLVTARVARVITVQLPDGREQEKFVVLGFGESLEATEPLELLQAMAADGVICYFTAVGYHGLTTQPVSHHHVARLRHYPPYGDLRPSEETATRGAAFSGRGRTFDPLGSKQFAHKGIPYYLTQREGRLVPGMQKRYLDERTIIRITTLEQTLLDTLHKPLSCGGGAVVFEAWETGLEKLNEGRLVTYLQAIANSELDRRVGYMLESLGHKPGRALEARLAAVREDLAAVGQSAAVPLLPGLPSDDVNLRWSVEVP